MVNFAHFKIIGRSTVTVVVELSDINEKLKNKKYSALAVAILYPRCDVLLCDRKGYTGGKYFDIAKSLGCTGYRLMSRDEILRAIGLDKFGYLVTITSFSDKFALIFLSDNYGNGNYGMYNSPTYSYQKIMELLNDNKS